MTETVKQNEEFVCSGKGMDVYKKKSSGKVPEWPLCSVMLLFSPIFLVNDLVISFPNSLLGEKLRTGSVADNSGSLFSVHLC